MHKGWCISSFYLLLGVELALLSSNGLLAADESNEDEELQLALAASMENYKEVSKDDGQKEGSDASAEAKVKKPAYLPLPEEPKGDRSLLCRIGVRLPDGHRVQRSFLRTDPVQVNYLIGRINIGNLAMQ